MSKSKFTGLTLNHIRFLREVLLLLAGIHTNL